MNWKLTLIKGLVVGALATLAVWIAEAQGLQTGTGGAVPPWAAGCAVLILEAVRDYLKTRFGVEAK